LQTYFNVYIKKHSFLILDSYIKTNGVSQSSTVYIYSASLALDKNHGTFQHTTINVNGWWKVEFISTVFISQVEIINREDCCQSVGDNLDIITTFTAKGQTHHTVCTNTGILGAGKTLNCYRFADEMKIYKHDGGHIHVAEVYIYGLLVNTW